MYPPESNMQHLSLTHVGVSWSDSGLSKVPVCSSKDGFTYQKCSAGKETTEHAPMVEIRKRSKIFQPVHAPRLPSTCLPTKALVLRTLCEFAGNLYSFLVFCDINLCTGDCSSPGTEGNLKLDTVASVKQEKSRQSNGMQ